MEPFNHRLNIYIESWMGPRGKVPHPLPFAAVRVTPASLPPQLPVIVWGPEELLSSTSKSELKNSIKENGGWLVQGLVGWTPSQKEPGLIPNVFFCSVCLQAFLSKMTNSSCSVITLNSLCFGPERLLNSKTSAYHYHYCGYSFLEPNVSFPTAYLRSWLSYGTYVKHNPFRCQTNRLLGLLLR